MIEEAIKEGVLRRLASMPPEKEIIINAKPFRRDELIRHVTKDDLIGQKMIERELKIRRALANNGVWL